LVNSGMSFAEAKNALATGGANMTPSGGAPGIEMTALPDSSLGGEDRREPYDVSATKTRQNYDAGGLDEFGNDLKRSAQNASEFLYPEETWDKQFSIMDKAGRDFKKAPLNINQHLGNAVDFMREPASQLWGSIKDTAGDVGRTAKEMGRGLLAETGMDVGTGPFVREGSTGTIDQLKAMTEMNANAPSYADEPNDGVGWLEGGGLDPLFAMFDKDPKDSGYDPDWTAMSDAEFAKDVQAETNGIVDVAAADNPEVAAALEKEIILGGDPSVNAQRADAEGVVERGGKSGNTGDQMMKLIAEQKRMALSNGIMQLGAGIAGGDISKGISAMGNSMAEGQKQVNMTTQEKMRQDWLDAQQGRTLAQRRAEVEAGYGYGGRGGDTAKIQSAKWFMDLTPDQQQMVMKYEGREMPSDKARAIVNRVIGDRAAMGDKMLESEIFDLEVQLGLRPPTMPRVTTAEEYNALETGTMFIDADGNKRRKT